MLNFFKEKEEKQQAFRKEQMSMVKDDFTLRNQKEEARAKKAEEAAAPDDHLTTEPPEAFAADALTDATHPTTRERKQRSWKASQQKCEENWASKRRLLIDTAIEMLAPSSNFCWKCSAFYRETPLLDQHALKPETIQAVKDMQLAIKRTFSSATKEGKDRKPSADWLQYCPFIVVTKPMTDLCWRCQANNTRIFRNANLMDEEKNELLLKQQRHLSQEEAMSFTSTVIFPALTSSNTSERDTLAVGTVWSGRKGLTDCMHPKQVKLKKEESMHRRKGNLLCMRYRDKKDVFLLSTYHKTGKITTGTDRHGQPKPGPASQTSAVSWKRLESQTGMQRTGVIQPEDAHKVTGVTVAAQMS
ncbi:hypothetical protein BaRGS_00035139, partial [Batillaria attramentaria]